MATLLLNRGKNKFTGQHIYSFSAFYNTTIPLVFLSLLCNYLRFSSPYIRITLTPYTPLPYLDFILHLCLFIPYSHHHFITATIYYMVFTPLPFFFLLDYVSFYCTLSDIFLPISVSPPFNFPLLCLESNRNC